MILTAKHLTKIMLFLKETRAQLFVPHLNEACDKFEINTPLRQAAFLAQVAHETGELKFMREIASGAAYEGRKDLGNIHPGDGEKFPGRGILQTTGYNNYLYTNKRIKEVYDEELDLMNHPERLEELRWGCAAGGVFWERNHLNALADSGDFNGITKRINGGTTGEKKRLLYWALAKNILGGA